MAVPVLCVISGLQELDMWLERVASIGFKGISKSKLARFFMPYNIFKFIFIGDENIALS
jgi:hypothetical protein